MDRKSSDTPFLAGPDTLAITDVAHPFSFKGSRDEKLNAAVVEAVNRMGGVGDGAEARYQQVLGELGKRAPEAVKVIAVAYEALPEDGYLDRWSLVQLLSELRSPAAADSLDRIVASRVPTERARDPHAFSTVTEEVMIRTTAVEGLARLSAEGMDEARAMLLTHAEHEAFSVRRASVQGLMETGSDEDRRRLREVLDKRGELHLLDIGRIDVREAPQAAGGRFVVPPDVKAEPPPHDLGREER